MICKLMDRTGFDTVILEAVAPSDGIGQELGHLPSHPFVVRSGALYADIPGSFWDVELEEEKKQAPTSASHESRALFSKPAGQRNLHSSVSFPSVQIPAMDLSSPRLLRNFTKLAVALLVSETSETPASRLRFEGIAAPIGIEVDFVGIDKNRFVRLENLELRTGRLFAKELQLARFPTFALSGKHHDVFLSGQVPQDFQTTVQAPKNIPSISGRRLKGMRHSAIFSREAPRRIDLKRRIAKFSRERRSLSSSWCLDLSMRKRSRSRRQTIAGIVDRTPIVEAIPSLLRQDPTFADEVRTAIEDARQKALAELDNEFDEPRRKAETELTVARETLENLKRETSLASERLQAFDASAASAKAAFKNDIEEAVIQFLGEGAIDLADRVTALEVASEPDDRTADSFAAVDRILADDRLIERIASAVRARDDGEPNEMAPDRALDEDGVGRSNSLRAWAYEAALQYPLLSAILAVSMSARVPVLYGPAADRAAEAICMAVAGGDAFATVHCDPTLISFGDLIGRQGEFFTPFKDAIETANACPELLIPVLLRNVNYAPCQFWLGAIAERSAVTPLPRNMIVVATLATDDVKVAIPEAFWQHLIPFAVEHLPSESQKAAPADLVTIKSKRWPYRSPAAGPFPSGLTSALLRVARKACGVSFDAEIAQEADTLLKTACGYLELYPEDIERGFHIPLQWKRRRNFAEDEEIARSIEILGS